MDFKPLHRPANANFRSQTSENSMLIHSTLRASAWLVSSENYATGRTQLERYVVSNNIVETAYKTIFPYWLTVPTKLNSIVGDTLHESTRPVRTPQEKKEAYQETLDSHGW